MSTLGGIKTKKHFFSTYFLPSLTMFALGFPQSIHSVWKEVDLLTCEGIKFLFALSRLAIWWGCQAWGENSSAFKLRANLLIDILYILIYFFSNTRPYLPYPICPLFVHWLIFSRLGGGAGDHYFFPLWNGKGSQTKFKFFNCHMLNNYSEAVVEAVQWNS